MNIRDLNKIRGTLLGADVRNISRKVFLENKDKFFNVVLNFYEKRNTFSNEFGRDFVETFEHAFSDPKKPAIITGVKDCFCCGANLDIITSGKGFDLKDYLSTVTTELDRIEHSDKIFIAAVNGYCLGGGLELAMATDYIIASRDAKFGLPEIKLGLIPGADGIKRLVRCVGKRRAMDIIITGRVMSAKEALEIGLINEVVSRWNLMKRAEEFANDIASKNPVAVKAIKRLANRAQYYDITNDEIKSFQECLKTEYTQNAISAFLTRKK
jgi:enoyl-CoA hydratase/carnithine racemase